MAVDGAARVAWADSYLCGSAGVRARGITVRLLAYTVSLDQFFTAWATTERIRFDARYG